MRRVKDAAPRATTPTPTPTLLGLRRVKDAAAIDHADADPPRSSETVRAAGPMDLQPPRATPRLRRSAFWR